jgi:uncharacterized protein (DUF58 family)
VLFIDRCKRQQFFGTFKQSKQELITEIAAVIAFSAISNNDKAGLIFFSDKVEKYIPAKKAKNMYCT